jgi:preprotein translocase subunit SecD
MELGFGRAWESIRDANVCTLITTFVLFNPFDWSFLNTSGMVRGFALTLGLGVVLEMFTGIVVVRTLMRVLYGKGGAR